MKGRWTTAILLAFIMTFVTACGGQSTLPGQEGVEVDENKTQLLVATFEGGLGTQWIRESADRFEETFKDVSFEEGKKGVQVRITKSTNYGGESVLDTLKTEEADVWFTETVNYQDHINYENFADITDIVTEPLSEYGETESIADKIDPAYREFLNVGTDAEPKYYGIPFYDGFYGLTYDVDMFAEQNLYFKDGADELEFVTSASDVKSAGVDGKLGTYDDGLPATYAQLKALLEKMIEKDITPFVYGGGNAMGYTVRLMASFWAQAAGEKEYKLNSTFDGKSETLAVLDGAGNVKENADGSIKTESLKISTKNGYELQRQASKYYVLDLFEEIIEDSDNYSSSNLQHIQAQQDFLKGKESSYTSYGILIDGCWWENEADESFKALATNFGEGHARANRNLAFMPLPVPSAKEIGQGNTLLNQGTSLAFIRSTTEKMDCAKAFLQFTTTDKELSSFTASVSMTRSFDYELTEEDLAKTTSYGQSVYNLRKDSTVVYPYSDDPIFQKNQAFFSIERWSFQTKLDNSEYTNPWQFWLNYQGQYSAEEYFRGLYEMQKTRWSTLAK